MCGKRGLEGLKESTARIEWVERVDQTCDGSVLFRRKTSAVSSEDVFSSLSPASIRSEGAVNAAAASVVIASAAPITRAHATPGEARTLSTALRPAHRCAATKAFDTKDAPKSSSKRTMPPVAATKGASRVAPTAARPPARMSTDTANAATCARGKQGRQEGGDAGGEGKGGKDERRRVAVDVSKRESEGVIEARGELNALSVFVVDYLQEDNQ